MVENDRQKLLHPIRLNRFSRLLNPIGRDRMIEYRKIGKRIQPRHPGNQVCIQKEV
jgi:hypothetical protein